MKSPWKKKAKEKIRWKKPHYSVGNANSENKWNRLRSVVYFSVETKNSRARERLRMSSTRETGCTRIKRVRRRRRMSCWEEMARKREENAAAIEKGKKWRWVLFMCGRMKWMVKNVHGIRASVHWTRYLVGRDVPHLFKVYSNFSNSGLGLVFWYFLLSYFLFLFISHYRL